MKVHDLIGTQEQLDEINLRHAAVAGIMGASMLGGAHNANTPSVPNTRLSVTAPIAHHPKPKLSSKEIKAIEQISHRYGADPEFVKQVIQLAKKYQKPGFPTAQDIIAIIAVESEFDPEAISGLQHDPAVGLMQIRPDVWKIDPKKLKDPETAIKIGANILHKYYRHLHGNKEAAITAYNVGMSAFMQGGENPRYLMKYHQRMRNILPIT